MSKFAVDDKVWYTHNGQAPVRAEIITIHTKDGADEYTVSLGVVGQTFRVSERALFSFAEPHRPEHSERASEPILEPPRATVEQDWWSLHTSLTTWLGENLEKMAVYGTSFPKDYSSDEWANTLQDQSEALLNYANDVSKDIGPEEEAELLKKAQEALHWVADHLPTLWD